jgi:uncharacterized protein YecE (DUF72 family)
MKKEIIIGCSSYNNRYWKGIFYPENLSTSKWFAYYCEHFDTYEMNGTFYKFPTLRVMDNWYKKAPGHFLFSVKAPKEITHLKKFIGCEERLAEFYSVCKEGLKEKLGYVLFQFPPSYQYTPERLHQIINGLDSRFNNVVEFRHESWWIIEVWDLLSKNNITFCSVNYPKLPSTIFTSAPSVYVRLHGKPELFYSTYTSEELTTLALELIDSKQPETMLVYFNNTAGTAGILNALEFKGMFEIIKKTAS